MLERPSEHFEHLVPVLEEVADPEGEVAYAEFDLLARLERSPVPLEGERKAVVMFWAGLTILTLSLLWWGCGSILGILGR